MVYFSALLLSLFITLALVPVFRRYAVRLRAVDIPDERKVHAMPMPRTGGLAMATGTFIPVILWMPGAGTLPLVLASGLVVAVGFWDDLKNLGFRAKFIAQIVAALVAIFWGGVQIRSLGGLLPDGQILPDFVAIPLTLVAIVGVTNAINLSDGLDGLAGGISLLSFLCLGYLGYQSGNVAATLIAASVCGAIFGFLRFNTFPASVFMGDAGSQLLGFLAITLALGITQGSSYSPLLPLVLLGFPVFDTVRVMMERVGRGQSPFVADRNHFHHKLLGFGLRHSEAVLIIYLFQGSLTLAAYLLRFHSDWLLLGVYLAFSGLNFAILFLMVNEKWTLSATNRRPNPLERAKSRWRASALPVRLAFPGLAWLLLLLTAVYLMLPAIFPLWLGWGALGCLLVLIASFCLGKRFQGIVLRCVLYLFMPFLIYSSQTQVNAGFETILLQFSHLGSLLVGFLSVLVVKLTRRRGYQATPLDFLILVIALIVPTFPGALVDKYVLIIIAAKIVTFFFGFEIYLVEKRGRFSQLQAISFVSLAVVVGRSFFPMNF